MHRLKLALILPVLCCCVDGLLWYWYLHSEASIPNTIGWDTPASFIGEGLNAPAFFVGDLILMPFNDHLPARPILLLLLLLLVAGLWYLIGKWLDRRAEADDPPKPKGVLSSVVFPGPVLVCGIYGLWYSFARARGLYISNFIQTIYIALLQTWAVFLIGIPAVGIIRYFLERGRKKALWGSTLRPRRRISNFRLLEMIVGVFATLVLLWLPPGRLIPK
jgi:hypothetical protein